MSKKRTLCGVDLGGRLLAAEEVVILMAVRWAAVEPGGTDRAHVVARDALHEAVRELRLARRSAGLSEDGKASP